MSQWLQNIQRLRAIGQTGRAYAQDPYDLERYAEVEVITQQMIAQLSGFTPAVIADLYIDESGYPTPKVDVRGGVFKDGQILLIRETSDGLWSLPGGWVDEHDSPAQAIIREVHEESGYEVAVAKLVALIDRDAHDYKPRHLHKIYKLHFLCKLEGGKAATSIETSDVGFFSLEDLPPLSLGRVQPEDIKLLWQHFQNPELATYFD